MKYRLILSVVCWWWVMCVSWLDAGEPLSLRETFRPGYQYHVSTRVELSGSLTLPPEQGQSAKPLAVNGTSAIEYDERVASVVSGAVEKTLRIYRRVDLQRNVGGRPQQSGLRPNVRRLVRSDRSKCRFTGWSTDLGRNRPGTNGRVCRVGRVITPRACVGDGPWAAEKRPSGTHHFRTH